MRNLLQYYPIYRGIRRHTQGVTRRNLDIASGRRVARIPTGRRSMPPRVYRSYMNAGRLNTRGNIYTRGRRIAPNPRVIWRR